MPYVTVIVLAAAAYLLGSIPFGFLLVKYVRKEDIRQKGSGNIGATNVVRSGAKGLGALTFLLDACKGALAVLLCGWLGAHSPLPAVSFSDALALGALFAILGHIYPVWLGFRGGKGVATAFGVFIALAPWPALCSLGLFILLFAVSRYVSLGSIVATIFFPIFAWLLPHRPQGSLMWSVIFFLAVLVIYKHRQNIVRLLHGTEYRFGKPRTEAA
ncbi:MULTISPECIES: glycerol-3-phosphate 1-O-acyltransferase PlsY [Acidobacterium]|uniref:Glycerol-3-phosphate acyltransferase n=1 Tax=Acidobacterium capsulatum (strain ATCC 51196 / DSM 11244 / BCRC 80197 / JCM 7670 / NBRC 15755 / NCIMB 13165 / 161) TaxID=240015 RepID=C1F6U1_ACIC5|nr:MULTISPECIES: glycerol-3-phosphate 1-O-acyltransferase PlsY [Acidobacterium]ACO31793.1 acyl-phosphate glycerol 3-phosphate acyltransferase [Acidobacterium capsulatum ATCC 51196]HCT60767.1 acyl-phosphate glycerol 3-phosphate acyltransferase [Acidobacterium sp.]